MKRVTANVARELKVIVNTTNRNSVAQFVELYDAKTNERLHRGQRNYIRSLARKRYNVEINV